MAIHQDIAQHLGQIFMVGIPGLELDEASRQFIDHYRINNFILFKRNVQSPEQLGVLTTELADCCRKSGIGLPLISIDQEGGTVARLPKPFTQFPDARALAESADPERALRAYATTCARELRGVGINMNLAPVLDVCPAGQGFFMERRAFGADPATVARLGSLVVEELQRGGVAACAKHFPGLGGAHLDPHRELPRVERSFKEISEEDLVPFRHAVAAGVAAVMTSHTIYPALDPECPATLSARILTDLLRDDLAYSGVIVTDDLEMGAIENETTVRRASFDSFVAGADMLLICHDQAKVRDAYEGLASGISTGVVSMDRLVASAARIAGLRDVYA